MKKVITYISALACTALIAASCSKDAAETVATGEGCLQMTVALDNTTRAEYQPLEYSTLRIYNAEGGLIRKYSPASEMPDNLYLVAGDYKVTVEAGDNSYATWTNKSYYGEAEFTITPQTTTSTTVSCPMTNAAVKVVFDATIAEKLEPGAFAYVCADDEFSKADAEYESVPTLKYEESDLVGYFLLPDGVSKLSWGFYGTKVEDGSAVSITSTANKQEITPEAGKLYTLNFKYSNTPDGKLQITVTVDEDAEAVEDPFIFSPEPTVSGVDFLISNIVAYTGDAIRFNVSTVEALSALKMTVGDTTYTLVNGGTPVDNNGIEFEAADQNNGTVTLTGDFFDTLEGGIREIAFEVTDAGTATGKATARIAVTGASEAKYDLWANGVTLSAVVTDESATSVAVKYRKQGASDWTTVAATKGADYTYSAQVAATWSASENDGGYTVYSLNDGIRANNAYEYQLVIGGADSGKTRSFSTATTQSIPYGDMEDSSLSCFTSDNTSTKYWGSGNNSMTPSLCTRSTFSGMGGSYCAKLQATSTLGFMAAGNLFLGTFERPGMNGYVDFGHSYAWEARPTAMKLKLHATIGKVNINKHSGPLATGEQDKGQVFVAVIDWSTPHRVQSGTAAPSGIWSPANGEDAVEEGKVIGYGVYDVYSTEGSSMEEITIPIVYYDTETKPSETYTLVISCSTSAYGDYMDGCDSNTMYVDDFEWVY